MAAPQAAVLLFLHEGFKNCVQLLRTAVATLSNRSSYQHEGTLLMYGARASELDLFRHCRRRFGSVVPRNWLAPKRS
jgi:hypothetical protein